MFGFTIWSSFYFAVDPCLSDPCHHGECVDNGDHYTCDCEDDYTGVNCESTSKFRQL